MATSQQAWEFFTSATTRPAAIQIICFLELRRIMQMTHSINAEGFMAPDAHGPNSPMIRYRRSAGDTFRTLKASTAGPHWLKSSGFPVTEYIESLKTKVGDMSKPQIPITEVLHWLKENHPHLQDAATIDRSWCWLAVDLRGEHNKTTRDSIGDYGFRFSRRGHPLTNGQTGTWGHSCERPLPYRRKGKGQAVTARTTTTTQTETLTRQQNHPENDSALAEAMAFVNS